MKLFAKNGLILFGRQLCIIPLLWSILR